MSDRAPLTDQPEESLDAKYRDATYLGTDPADEVEVLDLGFIVEDHDDRRIHLTGGWQRIDLVDTDEPLETGRSEPIPGAEEVRARGAPREWFATDYHLDHLAGEMQEEDFVETSLLATNPEPQEGYEDFTSESDLDRDGLPNATDLVGQAPGIGYGFGSRLAQDIGLEGFEIADSPLVRPAPELAFPISSGPVSDAALGTRDVDEMGFEPELDRIAERASQLEEHPEKER